MSLIKCPECSKEISEKAFMCPGCGYQMKEILPRWIRGWGFEWWMLKPLNVLRS